MAFQNKRRFLYSYDTMELKVRVCYTYDDDPSTGDKNHSNTSSAGLIPSGFHEGGPQVLYFLPNFPLFDFCQLYHQGLTVKRAQLYNTYCTYYTSALKVN